MERDPQFQVNGLTIGYQQGRQTSPVAKDLSCSLRGGEFVCLLGPNGAGKSTLIRTLAGMQTPLDGDIQLLGRSLSEIPPRIRARVISVVLTEATPMGMMNAYSLVALGRHPYSGWLGGLSAEDHQRIEWALDTVGATALAQRQLTELSDGERQKVAIARALAQEAKLMLLDEPTAFLDLPRRVELMSILRDLARKENMALLLSTHDLELALRFADRLWLMSPEGELTQGTPESLALSGELPKVFESERLDWDADSGHFKSIEETERVEVWLSGEDGLEMTWTQRALERLGFQQANSPGNAAFKISVANGKWEYERYSLLQSFDGIEPLIEWIKSIDWDEKI